MMFSTVYQAMIHQCTSTSLHGEPAVRHVLALTALSGGRGGNINPHETTRELCKTV